MKYWLEVSPEEQNRRLTDRIDAPRKIWKLTPMDLKYYDRWNDYTKTRDELFAKTDISWAPWHVTLSNDKKRARLNIISHLLSSINYKELDTEKVKLPKLKIGKEYQEQDYPFNFIPEKF